MHRGLGTLIKNFTFVLLCAGVTVPFAWAGTAENHSAVSAASFIFPSQSSIQSMAAGQVLAVDGVAAQNVFRSSNTLSLSDFPLAPGHSGTVELRRVRPVVDGSTSITVGSRENPRTMPLPEVISFRGTVEGQKGSFVFLNYVNGRLVGTVKGADGLSYTFAPVVGVKKGKAVNDHLLMAGSDFDDLNGPRHFECGASDVFDPEAEENESGDEFHEVHESHSHHKSGADQVQMDDLLEVELAIETDSYLYESAKSMGEDEEFLIEYAIALVTLISSLFEENINVTLFVNDVHVYTDNADGNPDPYSAQRGNLSQLLAEFASFWSVNRSSVRRDIGHIMSAYPTGGGVVGVAYRGNSFRGTLCQKQAFTGYGASGIRFNSATPTLDYTGDVAVMAHEIGHNFGAPHTHACWWLTHGNNQLIDTCVVAGSANASDGCLDRPNPVAAPGTIMSYCHNVNSTRTVEMEFHPFVREQMRTNADRVANACLSKPSSPVIYLQRPAGNEIVRSGSKLDIRWTSARVTTVKLEYSIDGGDWVEIDIVNAEDRSYAWTTPAINSNKVLVRVSDIRNENINDKSLVEFEIQAPVVTVEIPNGGEEIPQGQSTDIRWNLALVESVKIEYSLNNGADWEEIASDVSGSTYIWDVPDVTTDEALIRVIDESDNNVVDQSDQPFAIGAPSIDLKVPNGGEKWTIGRSYDITWDARFINRVRIDYSTDNGENWNIVRSFINADNGSYTWNIPDNTNLVSEEVLVQVYDQNNVAAGGAISANTFTLTSEVTAVEETSLSQPALRIVPNPAQGNTSIIYTSESFTGQLRASVRDVLGNSVLKLGSYNSIAAGENVFSFDSDPLLPGVYFLLLEADHEQHVVKFIVAR